MAVVHLSDPLSPEVAALVEVAPAVPHTGDRRVAFLIRESRRSHLILDVREIELAYTESGAFRFILPNRLIGDLHASDYFILVGHQVPLVFTELEKL